MPNPARKSYGDFYVDNNPGRFQPSPAEETEAPAPNNTFGGPQVITTEPIIPDFLKPIIEAQARRTTIGNRSLTDLNRLIRRGNLVAPLNADQLQGLQMSRQFAQGSGLQQAIESVRSTAAGEQLDPFGIDILKQFASGTPPPVNTSDEGFQNAFGAAVRQVLPGLRSSFAEAGRTRGGLSRVAETQAASDAFAGLFNKARERQLASAQQLGNLFNAERGRQLNAAQIFPQLGQTPARIIGSVGDVLQEQRQREISAPLQARQAFASTAAGSAIPVPIGALTGTRTVQPFQPTGLIQNLTAAGIDPQSERGQEIIIKALNPPGPKGPSTFDRILKIGDLVT